MRSDCIRIFIYILPHLSTPHTDFQFPHAASAAAVDFNSVGIICNNCTVHILPPHLSGCIASNYDTVILKFPPPKKKIILDRTMCAVKTTNFPSTRRIVLWRFYHFMYSCVHESSGFMYTCTCTHFACILCWMYPNLQLCMLTIPSLSYQLHDIVQCI